MLRRSLSLRVLVLLPLLATGVDVTRATLACGSAAQTCLEAAGRGWMGAVAIVLVPLYAVAFALVLARAVRGTAQARPRFLHSWALATAAVAAVCAGQLAIAALLDEGAALGGSPLGFAVLCLAAGALLALGMHAGRAVADLAPRAPRRRLPPALGLMLVAEPASAAPFSLAATARGRGPPAAA